MRVVIASDHAGYALKESVAEVVRQAGYEVIDVGTYSTDRVDFPDFAEKAGRAIQNGEAERGIVVCGSGVGACITANKMKGIYAAICHDTYSAHQGVEHDNMNVLCLGGRIIGVEPAAEIAKAFLAAKYLNTGNYKRRVDKILAIEQKG